MTKEEFMSTIDKAYDRATAAGAVTGFHLGISMKTTTPPQDGIIKCKVNIMNTYTGLHPQELIHISDAIMKEVKKYTNSNFPGIDKYPAPIRSEELSDEETNEQFHHFLFRFFDETEEQNIAGREGLSKVDLMLRLQEDAMISTMKSEDSDRGREVVNLFRKSHDEKIHFKDFDKLYNEVLEKYRKTE